MKTVSFLSVHRPEYIIGYTCNVLQGKLISYKKLTNDKFCYVIQIGKEKNIECLKN